MPALGQPENRSLLVGQDGRPATAWQLWFTALWRAVAPMDYFWIPSRDGAPTAVPETRTGFAPLVFDFQNNDLYVYNHDTSAWVKVTLS
jgi:hypothetical protein